MLYIPNGANWPGGSFDPETDDLYSTRIRWCASCRWPTIPKRSDMATSAAAATLEGRRRRRRERAGPAADQAALWGRISAIDLNKGEMVWQIAHGETPDAIKNHPALKGVTIPRTGRGGAGGSSGGSACW